MSTDSLTDILRGMYVCRRTWAAWDAGTMGPDDFVRADLDDDAVAEVSGPLDALRARAEAAEAAAAAAGPITVCDCGVGGPRLCDEDGLCVNCGCDVVVVADQHSADIVAQLRQEREAAEAALATARAEGAAAERAVVVRMLYEYRDHAAAHVRPGEAAVLAMVSEVIDAGAHLDQSEGA
jgi:hypothetical protein